MDKVEEKLKKLEETSGAGYAQASKSYLPQKNTLPKVFADKEEDWRQWMEDTMDYFDNQCDGLRAVLIEVNKTESDIGDNWVEDKMIEGVHRAETLNMVKLWRGLKGLTDGEARKVVNSVVGENGFKAWQKLI